ncbi:protocadherin-8 [Ornithorhynchus anatinus]|uniref:Protocadherin 8 n=1 Tax=Ornithorhynchus anatinus TaxID=9258 RepID=A0A6I8N6K1_ORNAN|nr:protocadherin-8 [Ornithorhynchus anatinus]
MSSAQVAPFRPPASSPQEAVAAAPPRDATEPGGMPLFRRGGRGCPVPLEGVCLCWLLSLALGKTVKYSTYEEAPPGTVIGTLAEELPAGAEGGPSSYRPVEPQQLQPPREREREAEEGEPREAEEGEPQEGEPGAERRGANGSLVRVREEDGQLTVGEGGIDRERLCGPAPRCTLAFDVVRLGGGPARLLHVELEVRDINDHPPRFPRAPPAVEVSEGAAVGTRVPLEAQAVDEDVGANGLQAFRLAEPRGPFAVELQTRADGAKRADLVLLRELDRERQAAYSLRLVALDGGSPPRSATAALSVRVLDANDHSPAFARAAVTVELAEDAPVGSLLLDLDAADPDEGPNGDVEFGFGGRTPAEARRLFRLDPRSGRLTLAGPVDYERRDTYELDVRAQDRGPAPRAATCRVVVRVRDVNDHAPRIAVTPLARAAEGEEDADGGEEDAEEGGGEEDAEEGGGEADAAEAALVPEGAARDRLVALVSTSDGDAGANGQVRCALQGRGHEHFRLQPAHAGGYLLVTAAPLDRERVARYHLTLVAEDRGAPPRRTRRPYTVRVADENDNAPLFARPVYAVAVRENNAPGAHLATVAARDPDLGRNGRVTYRLLDADGAAAPYVSVDPASGALYALRSFDYEALRRLDLRVQASDGGSPSLSSSALVRVQVLDQNDHAPVLVAPPPTDNGSLEVAVPARAPRGAAVARLEARDADEGANGELAFALLRQEPREAFAIDRRTGQIALAEDLSREPPGRVFRALLAVSDAGRPPLSTTAAVRFVVTAEGGGEGLGTVLPAPERPPPREGAAGPGPLQWDTPLIVIVVLAGSCTLLLAAIVAIAATCHRRKKEGRKGAGGGGPRPDERPGGQGGGGGGGQGGGSPSSAASTPPGRPGARRPAPGASGFDVPGFAGGLATESAPPAPAGGPASEGGGGGGGDHRPRPPALQSDGPKRLRGARAEPYASAPGFGKEPGPPVAIWKGHSFNAISGREADKFSGKDSGKGDSDFNDSDSDISGDALKKDLIHHMQSGLWACTAECRILGHSDRCWSPSCGRTNPHPPPHPSAQLSTFCKSTSLPRDPLRRDNFYQAQLPKTVGLQSVYEKVLHRDYDRTITLLSPPRAGRLPDLQEIGVPVYQPPPVRYLSPQTGSNGNM